MAKSIVKLLLGYIVVCLIWTTIMCLILNGITNYIIAINARRIVKISIIITIILFIISFIFERIKVRFLPQIVTIIFGTDKHYVDRYDSGNFKYERIKSLYLFLALIPVVIVAIVFLVLSIARFGVLNGRIAACLAAGNGKALNNSAYIHAALQIEIFVSLAVTSFIYLLMSIYQILTRTCFKCGAYMSFIETETLDSSSYSYDENWADKNYGESDVYINNQRYTVRKENWQHYKRKVTTTITTLLCRCKNCGHETEFQEREEDKDDWNSY